MNGCNYHPSEFTIHHSPFMGGKRRGSYLVRLTALSNHLRLRSFQVMSILLGSLHPPCNALCRMGHFAEVWRPRTRRTDPLIHNSLSASDRAPERNQFTQPNDGPAPNQETRCRL